METPEQQQVKEEQYFNSQEENVSVLVETKIPEQQQVKEEQNDEYISPDTKASSTSAESTVPKSEPTSPCELFSFSAAATVSAGEGRESRWSESDGSSSHQQLMEGKEEEESLNICGECFFL